MSDLRELYQQIILDHNKKPCNFGTLPRADHQAEGYNPICGDRVIVELKLKRGQLVEIAFQGAGCAISTASASIMTQVVKNKTLDQIEELFRAFQRLVMGKLNATTEGHLGTLAVFRGVSEFPVRVKCATLAWHTLRAALKKSANVISTE
jgi:nitrogen fixation NifU-like protein